MHIFIRSTFQHETCTDDILEFLNLHFISLNSFLMAVGTTKETPFIFNLLGLRKRSQASLKPGAWLAIIPRQQASKPF